MQTWLSVSEALPTEDGFRALVVVRASTGLSPIASSCPAHITVKSTAIWAKGHWHTDKHGEVTHWMPLPADPPQAD